LPSKRNVLLRVVVGLVVLAAIAAALLYVRKQREPKPLVLAGTLEARTVNVGSLVGGRVTRVHVDEGSQVAAGEVLVTLETETLDRQIAEQQAAIATAGANLAKAINGPRAEEIRKAEAVASNDERERRRLASLYSAGIVSREMLDQASTKAKTSAEDLRVLRAGTRKEDIAIARTQAEQQQRHLATLMKQRDETVVRSTVNGVVQ